MVPQRSPDARAARARFVDNVRANRLHGELATHTPSGRACRVLADAWLPGCVTVRWLTRPGGAVVHLATLRREGIQHADARGGY